MWIGTRLTPMEILSIRSFLANGHQYHLYTYEDVQNIPEGTIVKNGEEILPKEKIFKYKHGPGAGSHSGFSNYFRYKLLLMKGGYWVDTDIVCLKYFNFHHCVIATEKQHNGNDEPASCVLKTQPNSDFAQYCWDVCDKTNPESLNWGDTGPQLVKKAVGKYSLHKFMKPSEFFCPIDYFSTKQLVEKGCIPHNSYAVHLWNEMWRRNNINKEATYAKDSIYEQLKAKYA